MPTIASTMHGPSIMARVNQAISTYSVKEIVTNGIPSMVSIEVMDGLRMLGQSLGSLMSARSFFAKGLEENKADATKLLEVVPDLTRPFIYLINALSTSCLIAWFGGHVLLPGNCLQTLG